MRAARLLLTSVAALAIVLAAAIPSAQSPNSSASGESFDQLYAQGQAINASIKTLTARFTETTTSSLLMRPLVARGTLAVERPSRVVLALHRAGRARRAHRRHEDDVDVADPPGDGHRRRAGARAEYFVNGTAAELRQQFDIDDRELSDTPGTYHVSMVPKRKQIREALTRLDLWVLRDSSLLHSMRMTFANGDTKHMAFENVTPNPALAPEIFSLDR